MTDSKDDKDKKKDDEKFERVVDKFLKSPPKPRKEDGGGTRRHGEDR